MEKTVSYTQLVESIHAAGLARGIICLHSSLKSFGRLEGGADSVLRAFVDSGCTLLVPTFTYAYWDKPPAGRRILQNGMTEADYFAQPENTEAYDQHSTNVTKEAMGAIPARLLQMSGRARGPHPLNSFGGLGPLAHELIAAQTFLDVYGPYKAIYDNPATHLLLIGVDLTKATPIHFAEERAGRRLFRRWARSVDSPSVLEVAVGSCSEGFNQFAPVVSSIETRVTVGASLWRVYPFKGFIDQVTAAILQNPQITHCEDVNCERCNDMAQGGAIL